jgi:uncharacterized tellurite resistance protein B-like protein
MPLTSLIFDLSLLYLALTYGADGHLDEVELNEMRDQLDKWAPGMDPSRLDHILNEAMLSYSNGLEGERFEDLLARLEEGLSYEARQRVLEDLRLLARADDDVRREEVDFISRVETAWFDQEQIG